MRVATKEPPCTSSFATTAQKRNFFGLTSLRLDG